MRRRVVITGLGAVSSAGLSCDALGAAVGAARSCLNPITDPRVAHYRARYAGTIPEFDEEGARGRYGLAAGVDRYVVLAAEAAAQAVDQADARGLLASVRGAVIGATCSGPMLAIERFYEARLNGTGPVPDRFYRSYHSMSFTLARMFAVGGPVVTITTACSASTNALGTACDLIRDNQVDAALAGGSDGFSPTTLAGFDSLKATCADRCAPFSFPAGMNLGEGAAFAVVEDLESARRRGATIIAEVLGYGSSNDAFHCSAPDPTGKESALAMTKCLADAGLALDAITYINAHGTGTEANDKAETKAMRRVFGDRIDRIPVSSTKGVTGHCLGAAGMLETAATLLCAQRHTLPPDVNYAGTRDGCFLDIVESPGRAWPGGPFMKNSLAFGGNNASIVAVKGAWEGGPLPDASWGGPVCVSGIGVVSPAGTGAKPFYLGVSEKRVASRMIGADGCSAECRCVPPLDLRSIDRRLDLHGMDKASVYAAAAARLALADAGFDSRAAGRSEPGLYLHTAHGPFWSEREHITGLLKNGFRFEQTTAFPYIVPNSVEGNVCRATGMSGHNDAFCSGSGGGSLGIPLAMAALRQGRAQSLLVGATDELDDQTAPEATGAIPGEGAAMLLLESEETVRGRGVQPVAEVLGCLVRHGSRVDTLGETVSELKRIYGIASGDIGALCFDSSAPDQQAVARALFSDVDPGLFIDPFPVIGYAESSCHLLTLCYALLKMKFEKPAGKKYIFEFFRMPEGLVFALAARVTY